MHHQQQQLINQHGLSTAKGNLLMMSNGSKRFENPQGDNYL